MHLKIPNFKKTKPFEKCPFENLKTLIDGGFYAGKKRVK